MAPRPAPDLDLRREQITRLTRQLAEAEGWAAVTMRRLAGELGVTQPVLYSAFPGRQALVDAVALVGFVELAGALEGAEASPGARMGAYLDFAATHPATYEAMFTMSSDLPFAQGSQGPLVRAFTAIGDALPGAQDAEVEVAWAMLHGLVTLQASGRLPAERAQARLECARRVLAP